MMPPHIIRDAFLKNSLGNTELDKNRCRHRTAGSLGAQLQGFRGRRECLQHFPALVKRKTSSWDIHDHGNEATQEECWLRFTSEGQYRHETELGAAKARVHTQKIISRRPLPRDCKREAWHAIKRAELGISPRWDRLWLPCLPY